MSVPRRGFLAGSGLAIAFAGSLDSLFQTSALAETSNGEAYGYGPLIPDPDGLLDLPKGFSYKTVSPEGTALPDGSVIGGAHDGMAAFAGHRGWRLVRNHEQRGPDGRLVAPAAVVYDPAAYGGTSTLEVTRHGELTAHHVSLGGTFANCAGGRTPWGTWLTCEETEGFAGQTKSHGWVFEVDPATPRRNADPTPLKGLGRFAHEAVCIDPLTRVCYLTEDAREPFGLFYRFLPNDTSCRYGAYRRGGRLQAMHVPGVADLSVVQTPGTRFRNIRWVDVPDAEATSVSTRKQLDPITRSQKLEGTWWGRSSAYFVASFARQSEGSAAEHVGQVWRYHVRRNELELELVFRPGETRYDAPDNITVSPYGGGVILAEDGDGEIFLVGVTGEGRTFAMARNALNGSEMAGVTFSPDGRTLFANRFTPGVTFAVTGPWHRLRR